MYDEYMRRNLIVAGAYGLVAGLEVILERLSLYVNPAPDWLLRQLEDCKDRARTLPDELVKWRDTAEDKPIAALTPRKEKPDAE